MQLARKIVLALGVLAVFVIVGLEAVGVVRELRATTADMEHDHRLLGETLSAADAEALTAKIRNAGAIFIGAHTPEAIGDYVAGSNHVLPTARSARFSSGLGVLDFMKRTSLLKCGPEQLRALGPAAIALAEAEGLSAHARSVSIRLNL